MNITDSDSGKLGTSLPSETNISLKPSPNEGLVQAMSLFLKGPISDVLAAHSGHVKLHAYENGIAQVVMGGGCQGCPSSSNTLLNVVLTKLQHRFGEDIVTGVIQVSGV
jgi:Fe-S cluster biogenesis protein NfuA